MIYFNYLDLTKNDELEFIALSVLRYFQRGCGLEQF